MGVHYILYLLYLKWVIVYPDLKKKKKALQPTVKLSCISVYATSDAAGIVIPTCLYICWGKNIIIVHKY